MKTVEDLIPELPQHEAEMMKMLRGIILSCSPHVMEKLAYNVPFFYGHSRICYTWPSSIPWGKVPKDGLLLGMCRGHLLSNEQSILEMDGRKEVASVTFFSLSEINKGIIRKKKARKEKDDHHLIPITSTSSNCSQLPRHSVNLLLSSSSCSSIVNG